MARRTLPPRAVDLSGRQYGRLTVLRRARRSGPKAYWTCRCACGAVADIRGGNLTTTTKTPTRSCGCLARETASVLLTRHGYARHSAIARTVITSEYRAWSNAKARCATPTTHNYESYGGRGITMCAAWRDDFATFLRDMGPRPSADHSLDRIDNDGPYSPENCRWATRTEQQNNRRCNRYVVVSGQRLTIADTARAHGLDHGSLRHRLTHSSVVTLNGVTVEVA